MTRINIYDEGGELLGWFDRDQAVESIEESKEWNGRNMVSVVAGGEHEHEALHRTKGGRWVLNHWSNWQGSPDAYTFVADDVAKDWLLRNGSDDVAERYFGELEDERGPGRPEVGPAFPVRFPADLRDWIDVQAKERNMSRSAWIVELAEAERRT